MAKDESSWWIKITVPAPPKTSVCWWIPFSYVIDTGKANRVTLQIPSPPNSSWASQLLPLPQFPTFAVLRPPTGRLCSSSVQDALDQQKPLCWQVQRTRGTFPLGQAALNYWLSGMGVWKPDSPVLDCGDFELEHPPQSSPAGLGWCFLPQDFVSTGPLFGFLLFPFLLPYSPLVTPGSKPFLDKSLAHKPSPQNSAETNLRAPASTAP